MTPEWETPQGDTDDFGEELGGNCTAWEFSGDETMHPFWAVTRLTAQELLKRAAGDLQKRSSPFEFNMEFQVRRYQAVLAGSLDTGVKGLVTAVEIPVLVNNKAVAAGTELILEVAPKQQPEKRQRDWKDDVERRAKAKRNRPQQSLNLKPKRRACERNSKVAVAARARRDAGKTIIRLELAGTLASRFCA